MFLKSLLIALTLMFSFAYAQSEETVGQKVDKILASKWYEKMSIKGYAQFRYNRLGETNRDLKNSAGDKSVGNDQSFFMRRARLVFSGELDKRVYYYIQADYATSASKAEEYQSANDNYLNIRDAYFDYALTDDKEYRVRLGISKVPFGFENLQSSSIRAAMDRTESVNTASPNERDTGAYFMYAPTEVRNRFKELANARLKGTGDYGMFTIGAYNGQTLNKPEANNDLHRIARLTYPFKLQSGQYIETSIQAYEGKFNLDGEDFYDQRSGVSFIYYPQPFGFIVEYNQGTGPEFDINSNKISAEKLEGGYAQVNYALDHGTHRYFPFVRYQRYQGGRKNEKNAKSYNMNEWEIGTEWQPVPSFELTASYGISNRKTADSGTEYVSESGNMIRLQAQFNY